MIDPGAAAGRSRPCSLHPSSPLYVESTMNQTGSKGTSVARVPTVMRAQASEWGRGKMEAV